MPRLPVMSCPQPQHVIAAHVGPSTCGTCKSMHIARGNNWQVTFLNKIDN